MMVVLRDFSSLTLVIHSWHRLSKRLSLILLLRISLHGQHSDRLKFFIRTDKSDLVCAFDVDPDTNGVLIDEQLTGLNGSV